MGKPQVEAFPSHVAPAEVRAMSGWLDRREQFVASLLYGSDLRLLEALQLQVKDVDFDRGEITLLAGKGNKDRRTPLHGSLREPPLRQLVFARLEHDQDRARSIPATGVPESLARKHPRLDTSMS